MGQQLTSAAGAVALLVALASCAEPGAIGPGQPSEATFSVRADVSGTLVATLVLEVTGPDIPSALVFNLPIVAGIATGTVTIPSGSSRTLTLHAYDTGGIETHSGSTTLDIQAGTNPTMSIVLQPLTGGVPITATLGTFVVSVTPPSPTLSLAGTNTVQLTVAITDPDGNPTAGVPTWGTRAPGVATVDAAGLVTANGIGTTTITAVFQGVADIATITVTP